MAKRTYKGRTDAYDMAAVPIAAAMEFDAFERTIAGSAAPRSWTGTPGEAANGSIGNKEAIVVGSIPSAGERHISGNASAAGEQKAV